MSVESKIIELSKEPIAKLAPRAVKATKSPDHGITIINKGAYYVIRDCAKITTMYLPILLYGSIKDPVKTLSGIFTKTEIEKLVSNGDTNVTSRQLAKLMFIDSIKSNPPNKYKNPTKFEEPLENVDVYGDYDSDIISEESYKDKEVDDSDIVSCICEAFKVKG